MKTLDESAQELKESIDKVHKARLEFMKAYEASIENQIDDARERDYFSDKFDFQMRQDSSQR